MGDFVWVEEYADGFVPPPTSSKRKPRTPRKLDFIGWGSTYLIQFLQSLGNDTTDQISQHDVTAIINKYVNDRNLLHPSKKKRVLCDEWLLPLFGRKTISRIRIYDLLEPHFAANQVDSDDSFFDTSDDEEEERNSTLLRKNYSKKRAVEAPKSCFAAIVPDNIKLVYLKRSLVEDLLKNHPETFRGKIVGSFVRIKSDPNDYLQKNSHMLVQVTGLKEASSTDESQTEILLEVSNYIKDVQVSMLSDDHFSNEECEDLNRRVKDGSLKRPTIVELEEKVQVLHEDITKHWLHGELALLQKLIDRANEKGWRRELFEYLERRKLLQNPDEQKRLLLDVPKVIADEIEVEPATDDFPVDIRQGNDGSPKTSLNGVLEIPNCDSASNKTSSTWISFSTNSAGNQEVMATPKQSKGMDCQHDDFVKEQQKQIKGICEKTNGETLPVKMKENKHPQLVIDATEVIDLSDSEEDEDDKRHSVKIVDCDPESCVWHYLDPQGDIQGPFSMTILKRWKNADYFPPDFKVWKKGQSPKEAILLSDIVH